ncbi:MULTISPECIES: glycosyltransferase family 2 protein [unclassified Gluconobacter]|uniref:glycosyltransferase family 2 protein n=1 Tax=unclassified Gluconobacter TaxID=2644261 RepID=UPI001C049FE4|nr:MULTISPECIES: glycosyltransferase family 2 protein [unclassified Gluconobacter]
MKVAVVAIVRDEVSDILWWLGWYVSLGVDTIIIFDDGSKDGTDRVITDAACVHDIRLYRIDSDGGSHIERQKQVYLEALEHLKGEFDWVGFLDADEYVFFPSHKTIHQFLSEMDDDVGAVGINWCNYGSSGHVIKPRAPAFHAFTHHYKPEIYINRHVKSFVRPDRWSGEWCNVHYFDVAPYRYVNDARQDIEWSDTLGITDRIPEWKSAKVMHYQLRSMEHYVERTKRRKDVQYGMQAFTEADYNDLYDPTPQRKTDIIRGWARNVVRQGHARILDALPKTERLAPLPPATPTLHAFTLTPLGGGHICVRDTKASVTDQASTDPLLLAIRIGEATSRVFLAAIGADGNPAPVNLDGNLHLLDFLPYDVVPTTEAGSVALRQADCNLFLSATPHVLGGQVTSDRREVKEWELFQLCSLEDETAANAILTGPTLSFARLALSQPVSLAAISFLAKENLRLTVSVLPLLMDFLDDTERQMLEAKLPA